MRNQELVILVGSMVKVKMRVRGSYYCLFPAIAQGTRQV